MAIGTPQKAMFGGKVVVPAGSQTFNSSGTFSVPVGVTKVYITGVGGTGTAGGTGNSGGAGNGGAGGSGRVIIKIPDTRTATFSGGVTQTSSTAGGFTVYTVTATSTTSETVTFS